MSYVLGGEENIQKLNLKFFNDIIISPDFPDGQVYYKKGVGFYILSDTETQFQKMEQNNNVIGDTKKTNIFKKNKK